MEEFSNAERRLCRRLELDEPEARLLVQALRSGSSARRALVLTPRAEEGYEPPFPCVDTSPWGWLPPRVYVPHEDGSVRPTSLPDYTEKAYYYALDLSSCWESTALSCVATPRRSLDLCAAPGGKTVLLAARYRCLCHTANEVNPSRRGILRQNLSLSGLEETTVTGLRPDQWAAEAASCFDLLLVDAPCSGQSLLARGIRNPGCLSASMINGNAKRQRGILLAATRVVAPGGSLLYTTCTYDPEENEKVIAYILKRVPGWRAVEVPSLTAFRSSLAPFPAYRLLPYMGLGAGGFCCLLRREEQE